VPGIDQCGGKVIVTDAHHLEVQVVCLAASAASKAVSLEEVAEQFSDLSTVAHVSIFGLFEHALADIRAALTRTTARE
jgi:hypothetical protein